MTDGELHDVFGVCPVCGAETSMELDDDAYDRWDELDDARPDVDFDDYVEAFHDQNPAAFLYAGFCKGHSDLA
ncbi:hypothetical protein [Pseudoscardovia radai]|uniref:hypothetical protein n=1 Tax=Pseudoscardovia radai TaxID=987066 RepID=UPI00117AFF95|nr:hypothetical protein [Pseudoscardovia radai]